MQKNQSHFFQGQTTDTFMQNAAAKKRNSSNEAARQIFGGQRNIAAANHQQTSLTFSSHAPVEPSQQLQQNNNSQQKQPSTGDGRQTLASPGVQSTGEYQSILLTRYLKEPRLPPSSTYYNNSRKKKQQSTMSRGSSKYHNPSMITSKGTFMNDSEQRIPNTKEVSSPGKMSFGDSRKVKKRMPLISNKHDISYRNQTEIMRKIFGNEQNYHQVKNLLVKGPYQPDENTLMQKYQQHLAQPFAQSAKNEFPKSPKQLAPQSKILVKPSSSPMGTKHAHVTGTSNLFDRRGTYGNGQKSPTIGPDEIILAKSHLKPQQLQEIERGSDIQQTLKTERQMQPGGGSDQVEKAIFDLQDVKNNYFQEKTLFDQKIQQIQNKQNQTQSSGFNFPNQTAYNRTATTGFLPTAGSQRPMTQGGLILKNQQLMADNNVLKGELEQISKEDLKERLVVAEMVMKKLFQRNKDLEDQAQASANVSTIDGLRTRTNDMSPKNLSLVADDFDQVDVENKGQSLGIKDDANCKQSY